MSDQHVPYDMIPDPPPPSPPEKKGSFLLAALGVLILILMALGVLFFSYNVLHP